MRLKCIMVYLYHHLIPALLLEMKGELAGHCTILSVYLGWEWTAPQKVPNTSVNGEMSITFSLALLSMEVKY